MKLKSSNKCSKLFPHLKIGEHRKSLISRKDKFLENTDKYIAVLYIGSNTGRKVNSEVRKSGWNVIV